jgi:hypothetical protein
MKGQQPNTESGPTSARPPAVENGAAATTTNPSSGPAMAVPSASEAVDVNQLTAEEQMARFEKELKENDWGHQPC